MLLIQDESHMLLMHRLVDLIMFEDYFFNYQEMQRQSDTMNEDRIICRDNVNLHFTVKKKPCFKPREISNGKNCKQIGLAYFSLYVISRGVNLA